VTLAGRPRITAALGRLLREPLVHFAALGAGIFGIFAWVAPAGGEDRIIVDAACVEGLRREHEQRTGRPPTADEERGLVERFVEEEMLYREAVAMGLDRGDPIVRRRLIQKMGFLAEDLAAIDEPTDAELEAYRSAHAARYREPLRTSFRHVFVSRDRRGDGAPEETKRLLDELRRGADPGAIGDPFVRGASFTRRSAAEIEAVFGRAFADAVSAAPIEAWSGPVLSSYGAHLVHVSERAPAAAPPLASVRARVRQDLLDERRANANRAAIERLRRRYRVEIASGR
jgi:peptidyl-prolyl cis-trans isomerase C